MKGSVLGTEGWKSGSGGKGYGGLSSRVRWVERWVVVDYGGGGGEMRGELLCGGQRVEVR